MKRRGCARLGGRRSAASTPKAAGTRRRRGASAPEGARLARRLFRVVGENADSAGTVFCARGVVQRPGCCTCRWLPHGHVDSRLEPVSDPPAGPSPASPAHPPRAARDWVHLHTRTDGRNRGGAVGCVWAAGWASGMRLFADRCLHGARYAASPAHAPSSDVDVNRSGRAVRSAERAWPHASVRVSPRPTSAREGASTLSCTFCRSFLDHPSLKSAHAQKS